MSIFEFLLLFIVAFILCSFIFLYLYSRKHESRCELNPSTEDFDKAMKDFAERTVAYATKSMTGFNEAITKFSKGGTNEH